MTQAAMHSAMLNVIKKRFKPQLSPTGPRVKKIYMTTVKPIMTRSSAIVIASKRRNLFVFWEGEHW